MSLLHRRAAHKGELELTIYTKPPVIFLEGNEAREEETFTSVVSITQNGK